MKSAGHLIVDCLRAQGVDRVFCVPGESYLEVLDGLHESGIDVVVARQEGGAAMMAEADGKLTGRPGVAMVTRGPGATNASSGVHVAAQDSTPMVLLVGQIGRDMDGREAFQEVDYRAFYGSMAKWVTQIDRPERIPEIISHAWHVAMSGRPGPVVIALPEDMLRDEVDRVAGPRVEVASPAPARPDVARALVMLEQAERPILIVGGSRWSAADTQRLAEFAERWDLPVACSFRRQSLFRADHPNYAGDVGLGINPKLRDAIERSDLVLLLGARFSENPSQGFELFAIPDPRQQLLHVHPGPEELGRIYVPELAINATPGTFLSAMIEASPRQVSGAHWPWAKRTAQLNENYRAWSEKPPAGVGQVTMSATVSHLREALPRDCVITNGAGNYAIWLHRFYRYRAHLSQLAPTSGSMGYGLPAAIAASLREPSRPVVCLAGDGCFQMTMQELGTAVQAQANLTLIICDNTMYGTIRMHQERRFPGRVEATGLANPDFAALARSYGITAMTVANDGEFPAALAEAQTKSGVCVIHLLLDPRDVTPTMQLSG
ncbi:thiamine pyrophosphate-binding protein [Tepidamorphus sp. 3E244]|uniref:thiamine pyrophosphate-binding protein n=1 Tax=Tepidamorphus sp. 3E244 TaxID=3385498 RepID=UPI0038FC219A